MTRKLMQDIFMQPIQKGQVKKTVELNENIILDMDEKGKIIGVEILNASKVLNKEVLA